MDLAFEGESASCERGQAWQIETQDRKFHAQIQSKVENRRLRKASQEMSILETPATQSKPGNVKTVDSLGEIQGARETVALTDS